MNTVNYKTQEGLFQSRFNARFPLVQLAKLLDCQKLDYAIVQGGRVIGWIEYKYRNIPFSKCSEVWLNFAKYVSVREFMLLTGKPVLLVLQFPDADYVWHQFSEQVFPIGVRQDKTGENEANCLMPKQAFRPLKLA